MVGEWAVEWPELDASHIETLGRVRRISEHMRREVDGWLQPLDLNWETFDVLVTLRRSGPPYHLRPIDLNRACLLTSGAMTNRLDRVEQAGLIVRKPGTDDRRSIFVELTPAGLELANKAIEVHFSAARALLEPLAPQERATLAALLRKLLVQLEPMGETGGNDTSQQQDRASRRARRARQPVQ
ncbi:MarR family winged helix-turn-helix transcriptional regulator [Allomesorhizobium camelthorni]|uniref:MarR family transcriptional regulator n=1 Tax=Allomesorhizobium camelthorni TaxID=475069 RepID=A0A6G4WH82_9HYPH|nr:MarR family transcriptional regulator [Mesorhizobium camelthorni]NGO53457.1 MarR family transcriptional regulator [Mesorhizobium camelthorni]